MYKLGSKSDDPSKEKTRPSKLKKAGRAGKSRSTQVTSSSRSGHADAFAYASAPAAAASTSSAGTTAMPSHASNNRRATAPGFRPPASAQPAIRPGSLPSKPSAIARKPGYDSNRHFFQPSAAADAEDVIPTGIVKERKAVFEAAAESAKPQPKKRKFALKSDECNAPPPPAKRTCWLGKLGAQQARKKEKENKKDNKGGVKENRKKPATSVTSYARVGSGSRKKTAESDKSSGGGSSVSSDSRKKPAKPATSVTSCARVGSGSRKKTAESQRADIALLGKLDSSSASLVKSRLSLLVVKQDVTNDDREDSNAVAIFQKDSNALCVFLEDFKDLAALRANPTIRELGFTAQAHCKGVVAVSSRAAFESKSPLPLGYLYSSSGVLTKLNATTSSNRTSTSDSHDDVLKLGLLGVKPASHHQDSKQRADTAVSSQVIAEIDDLALRFKTMGHEEGRDARTKLETKALNKSVQISTGLLKEYTQKVQTIYDNHARSVGDGRSGLYRNVMTRYDDNKMEIIRTVDEAVRGTKVKCD